MRLTPFFITALALAGFIIHSPSTAGLEKKRPIAIRGATIWTMAGDPIEDGTVLVEDGKITGVGKRLEIPDGAEVIDGSGHHVIPGMIDIRSDLFVSPSDLAESRTDAHLDITDALDLYAKEAKQVLEEGVTAVYVGPGSRGLIGGLGAVVRVGAGPDPEEAVLKRKAGLKLSLGIAQSERTSSEWRLGHYHQIRSALRSAKDYQEAWKKYEKDEAEYQKKKAEYDKKKKEAEKKGDKDPKAQDPKKKKEEEPKKPRKPRKDPGKEILLEAMEGKIPIQIESARADSIRNALRLADEFGFQWSLVGGAEAVSVSSDLARNKVTVIIGPVVTSPLWGVDAARARSETAGRLSRDKVRVALGTGGGGGLASRYLRYQACLAVRHGMDPKAALESITTVPASILGVSDRIGSIEEGKDADIVVLDGEPLRSLSRVTHVIRGGQVLRVAPTPAARREF